jgi:hypothetical protein
MTLERNAYRRTERNRQRFFASELVDALRGRHPQARVVPVVIGEIDEPEQKKKDGKQKFWVIGAHKGSKWSKVDYAALVFSPQWLEADGTAYQIMLTEDDFERVRSRLKLKGWACGEEHFTLHAGDRHPPRENACEMCQLLYTWARVYKLEDGEQVRNRSAITREQATIAELLLEASKVTPISLSLN